MGFSNVYFKMFKEPKKNNGTQIINLFISDHLQG